LNAGKSKIDAAETQNAVETPEHVEPVTRVSNDKREFSFPRLSFASCPDKWRETCFEYVFSATGPFAG